MIEKRRRSKTRASSLMADSCVVRFRSNWLHIYTPRGPPTPLQKSTRSGEHEAARKIRKTGAGMEEEEEDRARALTRGSSGDDVSMTSSWRHQARFASLEPGSLFGFWFGSVVKMCYFISGAI